jgi:hypothetical protein
MKKIEAIHYCPVIDERTFVDHVTVVREHVLTRRVELVSPVFRALQIELNPGMR